MTKYVKHDRMCGVSEVIAMVSGEGMREKTMWRLAKCQMYEMTRSHSKIPGHQRSCRVWDPGVGSSH